MTTEQSLQIIRNAFAHVDIVRIVVEFDPEVEEEVAKVYVRAEQLDTAIGEDGLYPQGVAMAAGLSVEVVLEDA